MSKQISAFPTHPQKVRILEKMLHIVANKHIKHLVADPTADKGLVVSFTFTAAGIDALDMDDYCELGTLIP